MSDLTNALYVRLPNREFEKLHRAAEALAVNKKTLVTNLVAHYVDPDTSSGIEALRGALAGTGTQDPRRVTIELPDEGMTVGHHAFTPSPTPAPAALQEVLTPAQAAALLQVDEAELVALAAAGELPGRRIGERWRFSRRALIDWLATS